MKVLIFPLIVIVSLLAIYFFSTKKAHRWVISTIFIITFIILSFFAFGMYRAAVAPDTQCTTIHSTTTQPPISLTSAMDYFLQGNYDYDRGNCVKAIADYTASIQRNSRYPQAYNNRAYTYMRMQNYKAALLDLEIALRLNPNYIQALMNRGDIHNYYYQIDRKSAIIDYRKVILLGGTQGTSVCGHLFMAEHNGWNLGTIADFPQGILTACH